MGMSDTKETRDTYIGGLYPSTKTIAWTAIDVVSLYQGMYTQKRLWVKVQVATKAQYGDIRHMRWA